MANSGSPNIVTKEIDLTGVVPSAQSSTGAMVGNFQWGPIEDAQFIGNEQTLAETFGSPTPTTAVDFLSAAQYLAYAGTLYVTRAVQVAAAGSTSDVPGTRTATSPTIPGDGTAGEFRLTDFLVKNDNEFDGIFTNFGSLEGQVDTGMWMSKWGGELGNGIRISIAPALPLSNTSSFGDWEFSNAFTAAPGTSPWAAGKNSCTNDEIHVVVVDEGGTLSGLAGTVLETFAYVSVAKGAKTNDGGSNYLPDVINNQSRFIRFGYFDQANASVGANWGTEPSTIGNASVDFADGSQWSGQVPPTYSTQLVGGQDGGEIDADEILIGFDQYVDTETVIVDFLIANGMATEEAQVTLIAGLLLIVEQRKDCVVCTSPNRTAIINNPTAVEDTITEANLVASSSYLIYDNNYLKVYDKYNDQYVYIPAASTTAGVMAATDLGQGPWFSPAGQKRGQYFGVTSLAYSASKVQRDLLYNAGINPVVNLPGRGIMLWGDKTKEGRPSAFDRINVRRLFLVVERAISLAARNVMFEFNDEFTRAEFVNIVEPYLREIKGRRGITEFYVQCDATNNTPAVVDRNELIASIFIKPARSINYVTLNFVAVRTGVEFSEVVGTV